MHLFTQRTHRAAASSTLNFVRSPPFVDTPGKALDIGGVAASVVFEQPRLLSTPTTDESDALHRFPPLFDRDRRLARPSRSDDGGHCGGYVEVPSVEWPCCSSIDLAWRRARNFGRTAQCVRMGT